MSYLPVDVLYPGGPPERPDQVRTPMTVRILCFAQIKDVVGADFVPLELPEDATAESAAAFLLDSAGASKSLCSLPLRYAVNGEFCPGWTRLKEGDEIVPLPPVAGG